MSHTAVAITDDERSRPEFDPFHGDPATSGEETLARLHAGQERRGRFWAGAATVAVIALFVCLFTFDLGVYLWVVDLGMLGWALARVPQLMGTRWA